MNVINYIRLGKGGGRKKRNQGNKEEANIYSAKLIMFQIDVCLLALSLVIVYLLLLLNNDASGK